MKISPYIIAFLAVAALAWVVYSRREVRGGIEKSLGAGPLAKLPPPPSTTGVAPLGGKAPIPGRTNAKVAARIEAEKKAGAAKPLTPTEKQAKGILDSIGAATGLDTSGGSATLWLSAADKVGVDSVVDYFGGEGTFKKAQSAAKSIEGAAGSAAKSIEKSLGIDIPFI